MLNKGMDQIEIFTDGACSGNPGPGGWGAILRWGGVEKELSGGEKETTNNRMELLAVITSLNTLKRPCKVIIHTDSKYVLDGFTQWLPGWIKTDWKKGKVKNQDLWQALIKAAEPHTLKWVWVKGHAGHPENERADTLAVEAAAQYK